MRLRSLLAATLVTVWLPFNVALSCVCSPPTFAYAREYSIAVFSGKVIEVSADTVLFEVKEVWKGEVQKKYTLYIIEHSTCDFRFKKGENYLVYAKPYVDRETSEIKPYTHQCTRTSEIEYATEDLKQLGEGKPPAPKKYIKPTAKPNKGMHPTRNNAALIIKGNSGRVMPGVRPLLDRTEAATGLLSLFSREKLVCPPKVLRVSSGPRTRPLTNRRHFGRQSS